MLLLWRSSTCGCEPFDAHAIQTNKIQNLNLNKVKRASNKLFWSLCQCIKYTTGIWRNISRIRSFGENEFENHFRYRSLLCDDNRTRCQDTTSLSNIDRSQVLSNVFWSSYLFLILIWNFSYIFGEDLFEWFVTYWQQYSPDQVKQVLERLNKSIDNFLNE